MADWCQERIAMDDESRGAHTHAPGEATPNEAPLEQLMELLYNDLRAVAANRLKSERSNHTLQPTALVHEAFLRLSERPDAEWQSRTHFFRVAAVQIRRVLVDYARSHNSRKRSGKMLRVTLNDDMAIETPEIDILALDEALTRLDEHSTIDRQIIEFKFFAGLTEQEIATELGISDRTVRRRWTFARAWLLSELGTIGDADGER